MDRKIVRYLMEGNNVEMKKSIFKWLLIILFLPIIIGCSSDADNQVEETSDKSGIMTSFEIECEENLFFSRYDVDMYIDDEYVGTIIHGYTEMFEKNIEKGQHSVKFTNSSDSEVVGNIKIKIEKEETFQIKLFCYSSKISVELISGTIVQDENHDEENTEEEKVNNDHDNENIEKENTDNKEEQVDKEVIYTPENCPEFAELLSLKDESNPKISSFATKYKGEKLEFDANIAALSNHENYNTRYDFLILAGDYNEIQVSGPNFQFNDVNIFDLNLTGDNVPDSLTTGMNIHVIAIVEEYDSNTGLFKLDPVETRVR